MSKTGVPTSVKNTTDLNSAESKKAGDASKKEVDLQHMPKFIKTAPWYLAKEEDAEEALHH